MQFKQAAVISGGGSDPDQFASALCGIWIDRRDILYAAGDSQVKVFDTNGRLLRRWSTSKPATAIAVAPNGQAFVGEAGQIEIFDSAGKPGGTWRDEALLGEVTSIGFHRDNVLAADARDRAIRRYDKSGKHLNNIGKDNRMKGFLIPNGSLDFAVDARGIVHSVNPGKHRVERYTIEGKLLGHIGRFNGIDPEGFPGCCNPTNVTLGPSGHIYVTEKAGPRAKVLDAEGKLAGVIATGVFDPNAKNMDIAVDSRGRVYVADTVKLQVMVFEPLT